MGPSPKPRDLAAPKMQVHNFMYRIIISPNVKFLTFVISEFLYREKKFVIERKKRTKETQK